MARRFSDKVRAKALAAVREGQTYEQAGRKAGVSKNSIFNWVAEEKKKKRGGGFSKLKIRAAQIRRPRANVVATVQAKQNNPVDKDNAVSATLADGTRLDGVTVEFLIAWLGKDKLGSLP